jgi:arylsulfatase A-like enzyme
MTPGRRNVLLIVVDQWRADFVPRLGARFLRTPNLDRLCREGVTFRNHVTTAVPCGPARASLLTGLYLMNHRAVQNTVPLDARHVNLGKALRSIGYDPALIGYTTTTPDPRTTGPRDARFTSLGDLMDGFRGVGAFEPTMDGYFGWLAQKGHRLPERREDIWLAEGEDAGARRYGPPLPHPEGALGQRLLHRRALTYLKGPRPQALVPALGYYRPHTPFIAPRPNHAMYAGGHARARPPPRLAGEARSTAAALLPARIARALLPGRGGAAGWTRRIARCARPIAGMITEIDDSLGRVFA